MVYPKKIDLHIHTTASDGTFTPREVAGFVAAEGVELFSITDHDAVKGCKEVLDSMTENSPAFITGVEFSCKDEEGQYHVLGYGYDENSKKITDVVDKGHDFRMQKLQIRLDFLKDTFGFTFSGDDVKYLRSLNNPGKPHIGNMMVKYGYAKTRSEAITDFLDKLHVGDEYVRPEEAIEGILAAGGIPVLAHPIFGRGDGLIRGEELEKRVEKLIGFGLKGVEAYYSGFTDDMIAETLALSEKYGLFVTAGSDYHGANKPVKIGGDHFPGNGIYPVGLRRFLETVKIIRGEKNNVEHRKEL